MKATKPTIAAAESNPAIDPTPPKQFAYMSDTAYIEKHLELIHGVDCLYHEATFLSEDVARIKATLHSSAAQAATLAKKAEA